MIVKQRKNTLILLAGVVATAALVASGCGGGSGGGLFNGAPGGGGGVGGGAQNFTATFAANTSNANTSTFTSLGSGGVFSVVGGLRTYIATFTGVLGVQPRNIVITLNQPTALAVNNIFTVNGAGNSSASVGYTEGSGNTTKAWGGTSGTATITAISGRDVTIKLTGVVMQPSDPPAGGTNSATGQFTFSGTGTTTAQQNLS